MNSDVSEQAIKTIDSPTGAVIPPLKFYNSLSKEKEIFEALNPPYVGLYVCGPTVYNNPHIGNARPYVVFDVLNRYLTFLGYKVRYVRNITDVGHLRDNEEDRISQQAKLEKQEPMEIVNRYTNMFNEYMDQLNIIRPNIAPTATGHILEQIEMTQKILEAGFAYEANGSVYFDVPKYNETEDYGELSGRVLDDLFSNTRENLEGQSEKKHPADFALWKSAGEDHLMRWNSPWGEGFPGWHLECTVMSTKYLGEQFDIHGGGIDLQFPHHECEIAQAKAGNGGKSPVKYWLHNNMITVNGVKMSKSPRIRWSEEAVESLKKEGIPENVIEAVLQLNQPQADELEKKLQEDKDCKSLEAHQYFELFQKYGEVFVNFITIEQVLTGTHAVLEQGYSPMTLRFFVLQAHYRSTLDFSNDALLAAQKGYRRIMNGMKVLEQLEYPSETPTEPNAKLEKQIHGFVDNAYRGIHDDLNTALVIAQLFNILKKINAFQSKPESIAEISKETFLRMKETFEVFVQEILGLKEEKVENQEILVDALLDVYKEAKTQKDYDKVDKIRADFKKIGLRIMDSKQGIDWAYEE